MLSNVFFFFFGITGTSLKLIEKDEGSRAVVLKLFCTLTPDLSIKFSIDPKA